MTTSTPAGVTNAASDAVQAPRRNLPRLYLTEARFEFLKLLRLPGYSVSVLAFPVMFYALFGALFGDYAVQGISTAKYMVVGYSAAGVLAASLFGFGVGVASERGQGWLRLKRVSPMPPLAYFFAKVVMALLFSTLVVLVLTLLGAVLQGVRFEAGTWLRMYGALMLGVLPFASLGLAFGYLFGPNSAPMVLNLIYTPAAFASGLWIPLTVMPPLLQKIAEFLPTYHFAQFALSQAGAEPVGSGLTHVLVLAITTVVCLGLAVWAYFRDEGKTYG